MTDKPDTSREAIEAAANILHGSEYPYDWTMADNILALLAERDAAWATIANQREIDGRALAAMSESDVLGLWWRTREKYRGIP